MPKKYEREIEDILRRLDVPPQNRATHRRVGYLLWLWLARRVSLLGVAVLPSHLMVAGVALLAVGYLISQAVPVAAGWLSLASLGAFVGAIALSVFGGRNRQRPGWRGRPFEPERSSSLWDGVARLWRNWQRTRRWRGPRS